MLNRHVRGGILGLVFAIIAGSAAAQTPLQQTYSAHGGLEVWRRLRAVEYDFTWTMPQATFRERHTFDLNSRDGLIKAAQYELGAERGEVWIKPNPEALGGMPPRFYLWTPFYFFAMPFVFADPGAKLEILGPRTVGGVEYDAVKITFAPGTGDTPDDYYVAYTEKPSGQLKVVTYIVSHPAFRKGKAIADLEEHAIVFEEWQSGHELVFPKLARLFNWKDGNLDGEPLGTLEFSNVRFSTEAIERDRFTKPADAVVVPRD